MGYLKDFIIPYEGLSIGNHEFIFSINRLFFEEISYSEIKNGNVNVKLDLEKQETMLVLLFEIEGEVEVVCDRCTENFNYPLRGDQKLIIQFGDHFSEESSELIIIPKSESEIKIAPYIYEYINLLLPIQKIHPEDKNGNSTCNPEMLEKLNNLSRNEKHMDPRWDALKKLKNN